MPEMGTVKWYNDVKGFGFISRQNGEDVFVHYSSILMPISKTLVEGQTVTFTPVKGPKGWQATDVAPVQEEPREKNDELNEDVVAVTIIGDKLRLVAMSPDGRYKFIDGIDNLHRILYVYSNETHSYKVAVEQLEELINDPKTKESDLQAFFERNPDLIKGVEHKKAHAHVVLSHESGDLIPDFVLEPIQKDSLCDLLELKLPSSKVFTLKHNRNRFSSAVMDGCAQLRKYAEFFDDPKNRQLVSARYGLDAYKPKMFLIIGRKGTVSSFERRQIEASTPDLTLRTFDDVLERSRSRLAAMKNGSWRS
jgi:cold shock CspA family protein